MIEVNNCTRSKISEAFLKKVAETVLKGENRQKREVSIALVGEKKASELNKIYRKKDKVANVLSFPVGKERIPSEVEGYLGEIVLCPSQIKKDAKKYGMIFEQALAWMCIHGVLHLLGYDHIAEGDYKRMDKKERMYLSRI